MLKHWLEALFNPLVIALLMFTYAAIRLMITKARWRYWVLLPTLLLWLISLPFIPRYFTERIESQFPPIEAIDPNIEYVVVLSGGQNDKLGLPAHDRLYGVTLKRLIAAIDLVKRLPHATLILSGGGYQSLISEAKNLYSVSLSLGMTKQQLILEADSVNTRAQAQQLARLIPDNKPFYLVTSAIHMPRSLALFRQQGLKPIAAATDYTVYWQDERSAKRYLPAGQNIVYISILLHEWVGQLVANIKFNE